MRHALIGALPLGALLLAACAPTFDQAARAASAHHRRETSTFAATVERVRAALGADRLDLSAENERGPGRAGYPSRAEGPADAAGGAPPVVERIAAASDPRITLRVETGPAAGVRRIGYEDATGSRCGSPVPEPVTLFARGPAGKVRVLIIEPQVRRQVRHLPGRCPTTGCGTNPGPPLRRVTWLPATDVQQIVVERHPVPFDHRVVTCDHPIPPP